jgi:hypothetical protein
MPIAALLARIRKLIPSESDPHYDEIVHGFGIGELRTPASPMSDRELSRAIRRFHQGCAIGRSRERPWTEDPTSGVERGAGLKRSSAPRRMRCSAARTLKAISTS